MSKIILSLDNISSDKVENILRYKPNIHAVKIKPTYLVKYGIKGLRIFQVAYIPIMLDVKLHDTPDAMEDMIKFYIDHGIDLITIQASSCFSPKDTSLLDKIVPVLRMTTMEEGVLNKLYNGKTEDIIYRLSCIVKRCGYTKIVCAAEDIKHTVHIDGLKIYCPGIRPTHYTKIDDQKKKATPEEAIKAGADYLIIGRPLLQFKEDPEYTAEVIYKLNLK